MKILSKAFGAVMTNCYILKDELGEIVIDPGEGSYTWIKKHCKNILAVLNTHGHYDHTYDDALLQEDGCKIYIHKDDAFWIINDPMGLVKSCSPDVLVNGDDEFKIGNFVVKFHHFPGHTPGCCMVEINDVMFSGDFLFLGSIGRYDFPFSNRKDMKNSLQKIKTISQKSQNFTLYPGHGAITTLDKERDTIEYFLNHMH